ncbi:MAG: PHP domain-containing protein [Spirulina sp. SIO3F2]|nr:PHP domain-containing protein [Spirulina sp. SIO3F2]
MVLISGAVQCPSELSAQDVKTLSQVWQTIDAQSCPYQYNFHMHTRCSDGQLTPEALIEQATMIGLQGMAITDHHSVRGYERAAKWLTQHRSDLDIIPHLWTGVEITSTLEDVAVHILGYGFDPNHAAIAPYLNSKSPHGRAARAKVVVRAIQQAGGLAVLAHPARYRKSYLELIPAAAAAGIDGIETYYAYRKEKPWQPTPQTTPGVKALVDQVGLLHTCGTDTHGLNLRLRV